MTIRQLIGWIMVASPFVALFIWVTVLHGILFAVGIFAAVAITAAVILVGVEMTI